MQLLLIISGLYMVLTLKGFLAYDVYMAEVFLVIIFFIVLRVFFVLRSWKDLKNIKVIFLLLALLGIGVAAYVHCDHAINIVNVENPYISGVEAAPSCNGIVTQCETCHRCLIVFGIAALLGVAGIMISSLKE